MKKITLLFGILISANFAFSQNQLDTVYSRFVQLKGEEWWWCIAGLDPKNMDSVAKQRYKTLVRTVEINSPASAGNLTIDSLWGPFSMIFFRDYWRHPEARENMGQGIDTRIRLSAQLAPYIATADSVRLAKFNIRKSEGRATTK